MSDIARNRLIQWNKKKMSLCNCVYRMSLRVLSWGTLQQHLLFSSIFPSAKSKLLNIFLRKRVKVPWTGFLFP